MQPLQAFVYLLLAYLIIGCAHNNPTIVSHDSQPAGIEFLEDGRTKKEDVLIKLGIPSAQFEGELILTYRMMLDEKEGLLVVTRELDRKDPRLAQWRDAEYNLVLVFDEQHILQKHSLIKVR